MGAEMQLGVSAPWAEWGGGGGVGRFLTGAA